jgi:pimeloyl-ACP methyl ester carboxylesterase
MVEMAFLRVRWKYGLAMSSISPEDAVAHSHTPVLLIHGQIDGNIPVRHGRAIHEHDPQTLLWEVPGADHCGAMSVAPAEFERRVLEWFAGPAKAFTTKDIKVHEGNALTTGDKESHTGTAHAAGR